MIDAPATQAIEAAYRPSIRWSAVFAGWVVAFGIAWLLYVMGLASGFSAFDPGNAEAATKGVGIGTLVWVVLTWAVSMFVGGLFASWVDGRADQTVGSLHGVAVWGLAMTITVMLTAFGFTQLLQGGASLIKGAATAGAAGAAAAQRDTPSTRASGLLGAEIRRAVSNRANVPSVPPTAASPAADTQASGANASASPPAQGSNLSDASASAVAADLLRGNADDARARLVAETGMSPADADKVLQGLSAQVNTAKTRIAEAADQARRYAAAAMWGLLLAGLIALIAAALGGWTGAGHIHRVHDGRVDRP
jgi:hypothetical protein